MVRSIIEVLLIAAILWVVYQWYQAEDKAEQYQEAAIQASENLRRLDLSHRENWDKAQKEKKKFNLPKVERIINHESAEIAVKYFNDDYNGLFLESVQISKDFNMRHDRAPLSNIPLGGW